MPSKAALRGVFYGQVTRMDCKLEVLVADGRWQEHLHGNFWCVHMCSRRAPRPVISAGGGGVKSCPRHVWPHPSTDAPSASLDCAHDCARLHCPLKTEKTILVPALISLSLGYLYCRIRARASGARGRGSTPQAVCPIDGDT